MTLFDVDQAATRVREKVDPDANIVVGTTFNRALTGRLRVSVVATGLRHRQKSSIFRREWRDAAHTWEAALPYPCTMIRAPGFTRL